MAMASGQMGIHPEEKKSIVLGLDPGRNKTGFAFVNLNGDLLLAGIFPTAEREKFFCAIESSLQNLSSWITEGSLDLLPEFSAGQVKFIVIGNGTGSKEFLAYVSERAVTYRCDIFSVDESNTTLEARKLYRKIHKPKFFAYLIPEGLRVPPRILDDLAAWAVSLRGLEKYRDI